MTQLDTTIIQAFEEELQRDGFQEIVTKEFAPGYHADAHTHAFDVRILVTEGRFTLSRDGSTRDYGAGERFAMPADVAHAEDAPDGATLMIGRRYPADAHAGK